MKTNTLKIFQILAKPLSMLLAVTVLLGCPVVSAEGNSAEDNSDQFYLHLDLENLQQSKTGTSIIDSVFQVPFVQKQWKAIPPNLDFLKRIQLQHLTLSASSIQLDVPPLFDLRAKFDSDKLIQVLSHAKEYTTVESDGTTIHHWITSFNSLVGGEEGGDPDYVFLANPSDGRLLISTSLARVVSGLKNDGLTPVPRQVRNLKADNTVLSMYVGGEGNGMPGTFAAVAHQSNDGRLHVKAQLKAHNESDHEDVAGIAALIANPQIVIDLLAVGLSHSENSEVTIHSSNDSKTGEELLESDDDNRVSVSCRLNRGTFGKDDHKAMMECFFKECVTTSVDDGLLNVDVGVFLGPCEVTHVAGKRGDGKTNEKVMNSMKFVFDAYTSQKAMDVGNRMANAKLENLTTQSK